MTTHFDTDTAELSSGSLCGSPFDPAEPLALAGRRLHFVGVGGCGMSGLARMAAGRGAACSGSDRADSDTVALLRGAGIAVSLDQTAAALPAGLDAVVVSAAIPADHPERVEARRRGVEVVKYARMLGRLMIGRTGVAVAGTHGKSTTTSILCHVLIRAGLDPSFIVGANCAQIGGGFRVGGDVLVAEACEYDRSFHHLHPKHGVILNVEADHLDLYSGIEEIVESFATFAARLPKASGSGGSLGGCAGGSSGGSSGGGTLLIQHESPHRLAIAAGLDCGVETIGFAPQADWVVGVERGKGKGESGNMTTRLSREGRVVAEWDSPMPGDHFAYNAAVAAVTAHRLGASWDTIAQAVGAFQGLDRRMQWIGAKGPRGQGVETNGDETNHSAPRPLGPSAPSIPVIDDYGHHPTEVDATLRALRRHHRPARLICVFQPHQHSRTRHLMEQFAVSFTAADVVIVPEIYFVRDSEEERRAVTAGDLVDRLRRQKVNAMHLHPFEAIVDQLHLMAKPGDLIVTMGAGDVWKIGRAFLEG